MKTLPPVYPADGLLIFGEDLTLETPIALGMRLELPPMDGASVAVLNLLDDALRHLLLALGDGYRLQVRWSVTSDYEDLLEQYACRVMPHRTSIGSWVRRERFERHLRQQEQGLLRREQMTIYLSTKGSQGTSSRQEAREILSYLRQQKRNMESIFKGFISVLGDVPYVILDDIGNYREWYVHQNPSCQMRSGDDFWRHTFDKESSMQWMCENSDARMEQAEYGMGFYLDGYHQALLVLREWPATLQPGDIRRLTAMTGYPLAIVQNIRPLSAQQEIERETSALRRLHRELEEKEEGFVHRVEADKRREKLDALQDGRVRPFRVLTILRAWAQSSEDLSAAVQAIKTALDSWGMRYYQVNQIAQAENLFAESFPGHLYSGYRGYDLYATSDFLPSLLPASSTFVGTGNSVNEGDILLEGDSDNLCTLNLFVGDTPQNAVIVGTRGSGKSVLLDEILGQTGDQLDFLCIVEEGLSHEVLTRLMGAEPIILNPDGKQTLNYLDTRGLPLTQSHLAFCRAITMKMCGVSEGEKGEIQAEWLREYVQTLYWDFYRSWIARRQELWPELSRLACAWYQRVRQQGKGVADPVQAFHEVMECHQENPDRLKQDISAEADAFARTTEGELWMRNLAYAFFRPEEYPRHRHLVDLLRYQASPRHPVEDISLLASRLNAWTQDEGIYGALVDGVNNLPMNGRILHFELGQIPESAKELKDLVAFLLTSIVRQEVIRRPRSQRKAIVIEEAARFREIPGGDKILAELYAQMRKFSCWVLTVLQQYAQIRQSPLKSVIFGNSSQLWLLRSQDRDDLEDIAAFNDLPSSAVEVVLRFPLPEQQEESQRASYLYYWDKGRLAGGTLRVRPCREMLYVASSGGSLFEQRRESLLQHKSLWEGVCAEAKQKFGGEKGEMHAVV
jgi:hypothetical protein